MTYEHVHDLLPVYLDGGITDPALRAGIERHLESCATCRAERDATARAMSRIDGIIRSAGNAIAVPDVRWINGRAQRAQPLINPKPQAARQRPGGDHHRSSQKPMRSKSQPRLGGRGIGAIAGAITFALLIVMLVAAAAAFSIANRPRHAVGPTDEATLTATIPGLSASTDVTVISTALPTQTAGPTLDPAVGGFLENAADVSGMPEYVIEKTFGSPGYGGGGCWQGENLPASQTVAAFRLPDREGANGEEVPVQDWYLCLYDISDTSAGRMFTVRLTSPSGKVFSRAYTIQETGPDQTQPSAKTDDGSYASILTQSDRSLIEVTVNFPAAQEYGEWLVEGIDADGGVFATGPALIETTAPIYSVTLARDFLDPSLPNPLDPFLIERSTTFDMSENVIIAGRGLKKGAEFTLVLYTYDAARETETTWTLVPGYGARVIVADDGTFRSEFMIGDFVPEGWYVGAVDPTPDYMNTKLNFYVQP